MTLQSSRRTHLLRFACLRRGLGTRDMKETQVRFAMLIRAIGLGRLAPDPEKAHFYISESAEPKPLQRYRYQHGDCPLLLLQLVCKFLGSH